MENFKHTFDTDRYIFHTTKRKSHSSYLHNSYVYYTQIMQAETLASAYRLWRRNWKGRGREYTAGALVWQVRTSQHCFLSCQFKPAPLDQ